MKALLVAGLIQIIAILFKLFPPKKINLFYGYRTGFAMQNHDTWTEANKFSVNVMFRGAVINLIIALTAQIILPPNAALFITTVATLGMMVVVIVMTEKYLRKLFDQTGNRRQLNNKTNT